MDKKWLTVALALAICAVLVMAGYFGIQISRQETNAQQASAQRETLRVREAQSQAQAAAAERDEALARQAEAQQRIQQLTGQAEAAQAALNAAGETAAALQAEIEQLKAAQGDSANALTENEKEIDALNAALTQAQQTLTKTNEAFVRADQERAAAAQAADTLQAENEALKKHADETAQTLTQAQNDQEAAEQALTAVMEKQSALQAENDALNQTVYELRQESETARNAAADLETRLTALQASADEAAQALAQAQAETKALQEDLAAYSAQPDALQNRLSAALNRSDGQRESEIQALAGMLLSGFAGKIAPAGEAESVRPVSVTVVVEEQPVFTGVFSWTEEQLAQARQEIDAANQSQALYTLELNHPTAPALTVNGVPISRMDYELALQAARDSQPQADSETLREQALRALIGQEAARQQGEMFDLEAIRPDVETKVNALLDQRQLEEDALWAASPEAYAQALETGTIISSRLPDNCRLVQHAFLPVDFAACAQAEQDFDEANRKLDALSAYVFETERVGLPAAEFAVMQQRVDALAEQVSSLGKKKAALLSQKEEAASALRHMAQQGQETGAPLLDLISDETQDDGMLSAGYAIVPGAGYPSAELEQAALALTQPGEYSAVLEMEDGYHLLYFSEALTGDSPTVAAARSALIEAWTQEQVANARAALLNQWMEKATIVLFEGV